MRYLKDQVLGFVLGLVRRFFRQLVAAVVIFAVTSYVMPGDWGTALSVILPFILAFVPLGVVLYREYLALRREEAYSEVDRRERERRLLLEAAKREGIPPEVFLPAEEVFARLSDSAGSPENTTPPDQGHLLDGAATSDDAARGANMESVADSGRESTSGGCGSRGAWNRNQVGTFASAISNGADEGSCHAERAGLGRHPGH